MADSSQPRQRRRTWFAVAAVVAVVVIASLAIGLDLFPAPTSHMICVGETRLGNVTAWFPYAFAASPYGGSESGELRIWTNYTVGGSYLNITSGIPTKATEGNMSLGQASGGNWTVYTASNRSVSGSGRSYPCTGLLLATLGPPSGPAGDSFGGGTVATGLQNDTDLPFEFNASAHCESFGAAPTCAVSSVFDLNFTHGSGNVDTCGQARPSSMNLTGQPMEVGVPFVWKGTSYSVPVGPSPVSGMTAWFNYTFPANGGMWEYQDLPGYAGGTSGLVFSYTDCSA